MTVRRPVVIAHRGASGVRPEHTLEAYRVAIEAGADFVEPDLVATADGHLIARHENELSDTTDVASHPELADRRSVKTIDGVRREGWFSEDLTLAEVRSLRARERLPELRPASASYDGTLGVPTLEEIVELVKAYDARGRRVGIYPETKHPTWFAKEGHRFDGAAIEISLGRRLVEILREVDFVEPARVFVQSFEIENLVELAREVFPESGVRFPLVQLLGLLEEGAGPFAVPYDVRDRARAGDDFDAIYGEAGAVAREAARRGYAALVDADGLATIARAYAAAIGPVVGSMPPRATGGPGVGLVDRAHAAGLQVHTYTLRAERPFRYADARGHDVSLEDEVRALFEHGVDGVFIDHPDVGVAVRDRFVAHRRS